jgi:hypothetical protein
VPSPCTASRWQIHGAGNETRTRDLNLGKVVVQIAYLIGFPTNFTL